MWLGLSDPVASQKDARKADPERGALYARIMALKQYFHNEDKFTARDIYNEMTKTVGDESAPKYPDLLDAFSRDNKPMRVKSIGRQLTRGEDRVSGGFSIKPCNDALGESKSYRIEPRPGTNEALEAEAALAKAAEAESASEQSEQEADHLDGSSEADSDVEDDDLGGSHGWDPKNAPDADTGWPFHHQPGTRQAMCQVREERAAGLLDSRQTKHEELHVSPRGLR